MAIITTDYIKNANVRAFLFMLRYGEGTQAEDGYKIIFGGSRFQGLDGVAGTFDDFADHPRLPITRTMRNGKRITSTAAGAYQFLMKTWDALVKQYHFANFDPTNQDLGAIALIAGRKALNDIMNGRIEIAVRKCSKEWASLPGSPYGQPVVSMEDCLREYLNAGGQFFAQPVNPDQLSPLEIEK